MLPTHSRREIALIARGGSVTWGEWSRRIDSRASAMAAQAPRGGIIAFLAADPVESATVILAALRAGAVVAPISPRLPPAGVIETIRRLRATLLGEGTADPSSLPTHMIGRAGVVVHTSGSSGSPKAALLTGHSLFEGASGVVDRFALGRGDGWLLDLPLHHVAGIGVVIRCGLAGAAIVLDPESERITHASMVDTQLYRAVRLGASAPPAGLRAVLVGGGPVAPSLVDRAIDNGWPISTSYGLTEMGSTVTATTVASPPPARYSAGRPLNGREVRAVDGEICVRGDGLFAGYLDGGRLHLPLDSDGFFHTGDFGFFDDDGRLLVTGRADGRFVSGGENVQPEEIESVLASIAGVIRATVVAVPDAEFGHRGVAFVEMDEGRPLDEAGLAAALSDRLERFRLPVRYLPWPAGLAGMKPDRQLMASIAARETRQR